MLRLLLVIFSRIKIGQSGKFLFLHYDKIDNYY